MLLKGFGEVLTNIMTINPAFAELPSVSAILDTSNYTFQAVTFGKDAEGFTHHAHVVSSTQYVNGDPASGASSYDSGILTIVNYETNLAIGTSSYIPSATYYQYSSTYNSVPNYPSPLDTRLERGSTLASNLADYQYASSLLDTGHYTNPILDNELSAVWNKIGGFAPSSNTDYHFYDSTSSLVFSGQVSSFFNHNYLMDKQGYLTVNPKSVVNVSQRGVEASGGAVIASAAAADSSPSAGVVLVSVVLLKGDACTLAAFGGVKHIGVYCLDINDLLASGLLPPYSWDALNNTRKYKLVAKTTMLDNPLDHKDFVAGPFAYSGFKSNLNGDPANPFLTFAYGGPNINLKFDFK